VVQPAFTGGTDVHPRALADRFQASENGDVSGFVAVIPVSVRREGTYRGTGYRVSHVVLVLLADQSARLAQVSHLLLIARISVVSLSSFAPWHVVLFYRGLAKFRTFPQDFPSKCEPIHTVIHTLSTEGLYYPQVSRGPRPETRHFPPRVRVVGPWMWIAVTMPSPTSSARRRSIWGRR